MVTTASTSPYLYGTGGTVISGGNIIATNITTSFNVGEQVIFPKRPAKYWWKFTHYECPLCGTIDTVRERVNVIDQAKPEDDQDRHIDKELICGYHFT